MYSTPVTTTYPTTQPTIKLTPPLTTLPTTPSLTPRHYHNIPSPTPPPPLYHNTVDDINQECHRTSDCVFIVNSKCRTIAGGMKVCKCEAGYIPRTIDDKLHCIKC